MLLANAVVLAARPEIVPSRLNCSSTPMLHGSKLVLRCNDGRGRTGGPQRQLYDMEYQWFWRDQRGEFTKGNAETMAVLLIDAPLHCCLQLCLYDDVVVCLWHYHQVSSSLMPPLTGHWYPVATCCLYFKKICPPLATYSCIEIISVRCGKVCDGSSDSRSKGWELLYADDLVLRWKECMELKGLKVNIKKTKVMRSGKSGGEIVKPGRWSCAVCGKGVGANSIQCTDCCGWAHKRWSGARCPLVTI